MLWLLSGLGVGAGMTYLLDPEKGGEHDSGQFEIWPQGKYQNSLLCALSVR